MKFPKVARFLLFLNREKQNQCVISDKADNFTVVNKCTILITTF